MCCLSYVSVNVSALIFCYSIAVWQEFHVAIRQCILDYVCLWCPCIRNIIDRILEIFFSTISCLVEVWCMSHIYIVISVIV